MYVFKAFLGMVLLLWLTGCATTQQSTSAGGSANSVNQQIKQDQAVYVVQRGDTLSGIGARFGVTSAQLQYRNGIADPRSLEIGVKLIIPEKSQRVSSAVANKARFIWPIKKLDISSEFGSRHHKHKGIDLRAPKGTSIHASADGIVQFVGKQRGYGNVVILKHKGDIQTFYAHNNKNLVIDGQRILQGDVIASVGITGNATGFHLHFEYIKKHQPLNPRHYISD
ncbi:MAG: peptidoglycan DD-metalloendopeptidase family protein [Pseudomonadales bacterium]